MAACRTEVPDLPAILRQSAELDGLDVDAALAQLESSLLDFPAPEPEPETEESRLPLYDRNSLFVRTISQHEAQRLVNSGQAVADLGRGWDSTMRSDLPWQAVRLTVARVVICWDPSGITHHEMELAAGLYGDVPAARRARQKVSAWRTAK